MSFRPPSAEKTRIRRSISTVVDHTRRTGPVDARRTSSSPGEALCVELADHRMGKFRTVHAVTRLAAALVALTLAITSLSETSVAKARGAKRHAVEEIIIHATGGPSCQGGRVVFSPAGDVQRMKRFFEASPHVSIHYIVDRDGTVASSVPEDEIAAHTIGRNDGSIGIELINAGDGLDPYPAAQIDALARLVHASRTRWSIPLAAVKGHAELDQTTFLCAGRSVRRKQDPGPLFPWDRLRLELLSAEAGAPRKARR